MRKIALFTDIHANQEALEAILADIKKREITEVVCLGDIIAIGPNSKECLNLIKENNIELLLGNHELYTIYGSDIDPDMDDTERKHHSWVDSNLKSKDIDFLKKCKLQKEIKLNNETILLEHFLIENIQKNYPFYHLNILKDNIINDKILEEKAHYIFCGHEHKSFMIDEDDKEFYDIGSSGCVKNDETFYTILEINNNNVFVKKRYVKYDRKLFEHKMRKKDYPERDIIAKIFFGMEIKK